MIRILLADDHTILRAGVRRLLADVPDFEVVAEAATGFEAIDRVRSQTIDVAVVDVGMPGQAVEDTIAWIRSASPETRIMVLTAHPAEHYAVRVFRAGAAAYITKQEPWAEVIVAVRKVHAGGRHVTASLAEALAATLSSAITSKLQLSSREMQVLEKMAAGRSASDIAEQLSVSPKTVHSYRARLLQKLGLRTNAELIRYGIEHDFSE